MLPEAVSKTAGDSGASLLAVLTIAVLRGVCYTACDPVERKLEYGIVQPVSPPL